MAQSLKGRSLLTLSDYTAEEIRLLLDTAREYRRLKYAGIPHQFS
jgi:ornithine carbamoyltransferase